MVNALRVDVPGVLERPAGEQLGGEDGGAGVVVTAGDDDRAGGVEPGRRVPGANGPERRPGAPRPERRRVHLGRVEDHLRLLLRLPEAAGREDVAVGELHRAGVGAFVGDGGGRRPGAGFGGVDLGRGRRDAVAGADVRLAAGHEDGAVRKIGRDVRVARRVHALGGHPAGIEDSGEGERPTVPVEAHGAAALARIEDGPLEGRARIAVHAAVGDGDADGEDPPLAIDAVGRLQPEARHPPRVEELERVAHEAQAARPVLQRQLVLDERGALGAQRHEIFEAPGGGAKPEIFAAGRAARVEEVAAGAQGRHLPRAAEVHGQALTARRRDGEGADRRRGEGRVLADVAGGAKVLADALVAARGRWGEHAPGGGGLLKARSGPRRRAVRARAALPVKQRVARHEPRLGERGRGERRDRGGLDWTRRLGRAAGAAARGGGREEEGGAKRANETHRVELTRHFES